MPNKDTVVGERMDYAKVGGQIHRALNPALYRKLTLREYKRLVKLITSVFNDAQSHGT